MEEIKEREGRRKETGRDGRERMKEDGEWKRWKRTEYGRLGEKEGERKQRKRIRKGGNKQEKVKGENGYRIYAKGRIKWISNRKYIKGRIKGGRK